MLSERVCHKPGIFLAAMRVVYIACVCAECDATGPLGAVTYIFYLTKFYEFMDTFILRLRRKPLLTLHVWHHAVM
jgi:hypothetical protein